MARYSSMSKIVTCSTCGTEGRFGNQLFQAAATLGYAHKYGFTPQLPKEWIGRKIFDLNVEEINCGTLPQFPHDTLPTFEVNQSFDLKGYFQNQEAINLYTLEDIFDWFPIKAKWVSKLINSDKYVCIHDRKGDYVSQPERYCTISKNSFEKVENYVKDKYNIGNTVWLTEENPQVDLECESLGIGFLPDFMRMVFADVLIRSASSFSWWGSVYQRIYNPIGATYSPEVQGKRGLSEVEFVEGNHPMLVDPQYFPGFKHTPLYLRDK